MIFAIKFFAMWTVLSIAFGLVIAPVFARRIRRIEELEAELDFLEKHRRQS